MKGAFQILEGNREDVALQQILRWPLCCRGQQASSGCFQRPFSSSSGWLWCYSLLLHFCLKTSEVPKSFPRVSLWFSQVIEFPFVSPFSFFLCTVSIFKFLGDLLLIPCTHTVRTYTAIQSHAHTLHSFYKLTINLQTNIIAEEMSDSPLTPSKTPLF